MDRRRPLGPGKTRLLAIVLHPRSENDVAVPISTTEKHRYAAVLHVPHAENRPGFRRTARESAAGL
jgi:hypothetical protein